jgi:mRNA-degrading endonuclease RelE of RelBE toxin-antitoxin system
MASYSGSFKRSAEDDLRSVPFPFRRQIIQAIYRLKEEPRPPAAESLGGDVYRLWVHGWPLIYEVDDEKVMLTILGMPPPAP